MRLDPGSADYRTNRGRSHRARVELDRAIADSSEALRLSPGDTLALRERSSAYREPEDYGRHAADEAEIRKLSDF